MRQLATYFTLVTILLLPARAQQDVITTFIGGGPNDIPALQSDVMNPWGVALDSFGKLYIASGNRVFEVNTNGTLSVVAGTGAAGYGGDGGPATNAVLNGPAGVVVDGAGNIYFAEYNNDTIRKIDTTHTVTTIAGNLGQCKYGGDGGPATAADLCHPQGLALDNSGNLYVADSGNYRVRKLVPSAGAYTISTYAGTGACCYSGDGGPATSAKLDWPAGLALDNAGDLFINDQNNCRVREVTASNQFINTVAGTGTCGFSGDGGPATQAKIGQAYAGIAVNGAGTTVTFGDSTNNRIRQFAVDGNITTIAGTGTAGFSGDNGLPTLAEIHTPQGIALANSGVIYFADDANNRVRAFTGGGTISTVAGNGDATFPTLVGGVPPSGVVLNNPVDMLVDPSGNVFISEATNCMVRELVKKTGLVNIFAGLATANATVGTCGFSGAGGPATSAELGSVRGLARDSSGNIYISDQTNCVVWQVSAANGTISIFAGVTPTHCGYNGDNMPATSAELNGQAGIFVDHNNNLYIGDNSNNRVRKVTAGTITTVAGNGTAGYLGDGDPAAIAELKAPSGVAVDSTGNLYIADSSNCVVREVSAPPASIINTIAGMGPTNCGSDGDGPATEHELNNPTRVALDQNGDLFITDNANQRLRWVSPSGIMTTFAGNGTAGFAGDGGPATSAEFNSVAGIAQDASGNFLVADYNNLRVREVTVFSALNVSPSSLDFGLVTVGSTGTPQTLTLGALGPLTFSNISITGPFTEYDNCAASLANAKTCSMYVYFMPMVAGTATGTITIEDNGFFSDITTINLEGTGSAVSVTGGPLLFGNQNVNTTSPAKPVTIKNLGTKAITMKAITVDETDFAITTNTCPASGSPLAGGASCTISVAFAPKSTGAKKGALVINDSDPSSPQVVGLTGTGTSTVALTPGSITFPPQAVGTTGGPIKITLTNNTGAALTLGNPAVTIPAPFSLGTGATSCQSKQAIAAGQKCFIYVNFAPASVGFFNGTLSVSDSDPTSPQTVALSGSGTGIEFTPPSVTFIPTAVGHAAPSVSVGITNVGTSTITFTAGAIGLPGTNPADFKPPASDPPCGPLAPGATCTITLNFTPSIVGAETATYLVYDNSTGSPQALPLSGTGQ